MVATLARKGCQGLECERWATVMEDQSLLDATWAVGPLQDLGMQYEGSVEALDTTDMWLDVVVPFGTG